MQLARLAPEQSGGQCLALGHRRWSGTSPDTGPHSVDWYPHTDSEQRPSAYKVKSWQAEQCYSCPLHNNAMTHSLLRIHLIFLSQHWGERQKAVLREWWHLMTTTALMFIPWIWRLDRLLKSLPHLFDNLLMTFKVYDSACSSSCVLINLPWMPFMSFYCIHTV